MKIKKIVLICIAVICIAFFILNIKNYILIKKIYNENANIEPNDFYYKEILKKDNIENVEEVFCKNNIYLIKANYKYSKNGDEKIFQCIEWLDFTTKDFKIFEKNEDSKYEWREATQISDFDIYNPKDVIYDLFFISKNYNLKDLVIANLFNNIKLDDENFYIIKIDGFDCYVDKDTYLCKKIISNNENKEMEYTSGSVVEEISKIRIEDLTK